MRGPVAFGKHRVTTAETLRSFRNFPQRPIQTKEQIKLPADDIPTVVNPHTDKAEPAKPLEDEEEEDDATLPGDMLRMQYEMHQGGWVPVKSSSAPPPDTKDMGSSLSTLINRDVVQKIADSLKIQIPFKLAQDILKRHVDQEKPNMRVMHKAAKELMAIMDRETRTTVPPTYRHRLTQMLARAMFAYYSGKGTQLMGTGTRLRRKMDPNAYHPHAEAFVRGVTLALKPALSVGATAMSFSPSVTGKVLAPFVQAAANTL